MEGVRVEVHTDRDVYTPGQSVTDFYPFTNQLVFVDEERELWHYSTLQELLGLDHNANRCEKGYLMGKSQFRFAFNLPHDLATSFHCPGSPVVVKYTVTTELKMGEVVLFLCQNEARPNTPAIMDFG
ncbi:unnamed protein product [Heligmosomoides polygyrus]|uniref:ZP domain-containing protein n=1 Tax=Heligmosomoides polygyrus TaxID=6339 RepID=A0A183GSS4_HELPZ|nr:unnamed protein product [Heligmosomoides polygyrus]